MVCVVEWDQNCVLNSDGAKFTIHKILRGWTAEGNIERDRQTVCERETQKEL